MYILYSTLYVLTIAAIVWVTPMSQTSGVLLLCCKIELSELWCEAFGAHKHSLQATVHFEVCRCSYVYENDYVV